MLSLMIGWLRPGPFPRWAQISQLLPHLILAASAGRSAMNIQKMTMQIAVIKIRLP
jgi:hypothetical protein